MKISCPKCRSERIIKNGTNQKGQKYYCKECTYNFLSKGGKSPEVPARGAPDIIKRFAIILFLEGVGYNVIGRLLGVSGVSVLKWIRSLVVQADKLRRCPTPKPITQVMNFKEIRTFIKGKKQSVEINNGLLITDSKGKPVAFIWDRLNTLQENKKHR